MQNLGKDVFPLMMKDITCLYANKNDLVKRKKSMLQKRHGKIQEQSSWVKRKGWDPKPK